MVGIMHWTAAIGREAITVDPDHVDIAGALGDLPRAREYHRDGLAAHRDSLAVTLKGLDTASFGRETELMKDPRHPKK